MVPPSCDCETETPPLLLVMLSAPGVEIEPVPDTSSGPLADIVIFPCEEMLPLLVLVLLSAAPERLTVSEPSLVIEPVAATLITAELCPELITTTVVDGTTLAANCSVPATVNCWLVLLPVIATSSGLLAGMPVRVRFMPAGTLTADMLVARPCCGIDTVPLPMLPPTQPSDWSV